jgi:hypothetical protein
MAHSSGESLAASTDIFRPLIFKVAIGLSPPVLKAAYDGNSLLRNIGKTG